MDEIELRLRCLELAIASCKFGLPEEPSLLFGAAAAYQDYVLGRVTGGVPSEPVGSDPETAAHLQ
jgi:hypothetical protein